MGRSEESGDDPMSEATQTELVPQKQTEKKSPMVVVDDSPLAYMLDTAKFEHLYRIAGIIARASLTPKHLKATDPVETVANCFRVVNQAMRWGMDPFAVVDATYVVNGKLGYEGKLVAAVVNARAGLKGRLSAVYAGAGPKRTVTITGQFADEPAPRTIELSVEQAATTNQMWKTDPDQKLWYTGCTKWARRHCPEILLGVMDEEDLERLKDYQIKAAMSGLNNASEGQEPPIGRESIRTPKTNGQPPKEDAAPESPTAPLQDAGAAPADPETKILLEEEIHRTGISQDKVQEMVAASGAKRYGAMTEGQANGMLAELKRLPDKPVAPTRRTYAEA